MLYYKAIFNDKKLKTKLIYIHITRKSNTISNTNMAYKIYIYYSWEIFKVPDRNSKYFFFFHYLNALSRFRNHT